MELTFIPYDSETKTDGCYGGRVYLHGKLEIMLGNDLTSPLNAIATGYAKPQVPWSSMSGNEITDMRDTGKDRNVMYANGKVPCKVEGIDEPCTGYFWTASEHPVYYKGNEFPYWEQVGLIVLDSDEDSVKYAERLLNDKPRWV